MDNNAMFELADELKRLRDHKADLDAQVKGVNAQIDDTDYRLSELMAETETQNFTRAGTMFCLTTKTRASAVADRKAELYAALREQGYGDLVYETVNANSLSSFVKERMEEYAESVGDTGDGDNALPAWLIGLVNVFDKVTVGVRKAAKN